MEKQIIWKQPKNQIPEEESYIVSIAIERIRKGKDLSFSLELLVAKTWYNDFPNWRTAVTAEVDDRTGQGALSHDLFPQNVNSWKYATMWTEFENLKIPKWFWEH